MAASLQLSHSQTTQTHSFKVILRNLRSVPIMPVPLASLLSMTYLLYICCVLILGEGVCLPEVCPHYARPSGLPSLYDIFTVCCVLILGEGVCLPEVCPHYASPSGRLSRLSQSRPR